eukprot:Gb_08686 [translate_table: standard]
MASGRCHLLLVVFCACLMVCLAMPYNTFPQPGDSIPGYYHRATLDDAMDMAEVLEHSWKRFDKRTWETWLLMIQENEGKTLSEGNVTKDPKATYLKRSVGIRTFMTSVLSLVSLGENESAHTQNPSQCICIFISLVQGSQSKFSAHMDRRPFTWSGVAIAARIIIDFLFLSSNCRFCMLAEESRVDCKQSINHCKTIDCHRHSSR